MAPIAIIQARMASTRLPGKVLMTLVGRPMLWHIVQRVRRAPGVHQVVVATSDRDVDAPIRELCRASEISCFAGSEDDVLDRFYRAVERYGGDPVIRITADCPLIDPEIVGRLLSLYASGELDHVGVACGAGAVFEKGERFPDGLDAECFSAAALRRAWREAAAQPDREHVTPYIWRNRALFRCGLLSSDRDYSELRWTVDYPADLDMVRNVYEALHREEDEPFGMADVLRYLAEHPDVAAANRGLIGREGYRALWHLPATELVVEAT